MDSRSSIGLPRRDGAVNTPAYDARIPPGTPMYPPSDSRSSRPARPEDLLSPATQIVGNRADYLGEGQQDIGQRIADDKLELFVSSDPAQAMLQQFALHTPDYIALHDVGGSASLRLLAAVAGALNTKLQQLAIRRQGHGVPLATLRFVEIPGHGAQRLRVYSTDIDADSQARRQLANVLLGHSRLGVLMVGDLPGHALEPALQPVREALLKGPWPNRNLLLVPQGAPGALAAQAAALGARGGMQVRVTPKAVQANDAWTYVTGAWNRLRDSGTGTPAGAQPVSTAPGSAPAASPRPAAPHAPALRDVSTEVMPLPATQAERPAPGPWETYLQACSSVKGLVSACVFDFRSARALGHIGARPDPDRLVAQGIALFSAMAESGRALGLGPAQPDAAITLTAHHLLLHPLPGHPGIVLHAVLDASAANLTLARMQLQRVDTTVLGGSPARP